MRAFIAFLSLVLGLWVFHAHWLVIGILSFAWLIYVFWRFSKNGLIISLLFFGCGFLISSIQLPVDVEQTQFTGIVSDSKENYFLLKTFQHSYYVYEKNCTKETGDLLTIEGSFARLQFAQIESRFDFGKYLLEKGVVGQIYPRAIKTHFYAPLRTKKIEASFLSHFDSETSSLLSGLLFGNIDEEKLGLSDTNGLAIHHLVSVSGIHLSFWLQCLGYVLEKKMKEKWARLSALGTLVPLFLFSLNKLSFFRVMSLSFLRWVNEFHWEKKFDSLALISSLGVICCLFSRYIVYSTSFILSFSVPLFLVLTRNAVNTFKIKKRSIIITLLIFLFVLPINAFYNFEVNFLGILAQMVLSPILLVTFFLGTMGFYLFPWPFPVNFLTKFFLYVLKFFAGPNFNIILGKPSFIFLSVFFAIFIFLLASLEAKHRKKSMFCATLLGFTLMLQTIPVNNYIQNSVTFINVGQGDSILIRERHYSVLIDTGGSLYFDVTSECLMPYFKKQKINHIDYLITTHDDFDHNGGVEKLMNQFEVKNYVKEKEQFPLRIGSMVFRNLNTFANEGSDENFSSLVLALEFMDKKWLFMGDAPIEVEQKIIERFPTLDVDILKIGHHGSETSTSYAFLKQTTPQQAIVSVGKNTFGHPSKVVLERLERSGAEIRRTDLEGTISYTQSLF